MEYFEIGLSLAGQGVYNDPPQDITRAANEQEAPAHRSDRELRLWAEMERLEAQYSGQYAPDSVIRRLDWITGQIQQIRDVDLLAAFKRAAR